MSEVGKEMRRSRSRRSNARLRPAADVDVEVKIQTTKGVTLSWLEAKILRKSTERFIRRSTHTIVSCQIGREKLTLGFKGGDGGGIGLWSVIH